MLVAILSAGGKRRLLLCTLAGLGTLGLFIWPWLSTGRLAQLAEAVFAPANLVSRLDVSAYNLWYLFRLGQVHDFSATLRPAGLPVTYQQVALGLFGLACLLAAALGWPRRSARLALPAALLAFCLFMLPADARERYLFAAVPFLLLWAADSKDPAVPHPRWRWAAYGLVSITLFFNLVTVASFTPLLPNLVAIAPPYGQPWIYPLKVAALAVAMLHLLTMLWLVTLLWRARHPAGAPLKPVGIAAGHPLYFPAKEPSHESDSREL
jgi:hypothetical protein